MRLISYADGEEYELSGEQLQLTAVSYGADHKIFTKAEIIEIVGPDRVSFLGNRGSLESAQSLHFVWKPLLLSKVAKEAEFGEIIVYCDSSKYDSNGWKYDPKLFSKLFSDNGGSSFFVGGHHPVFTLSSLSSSSYSSVKSLSSKIGLSVSRAQWKNLPQAMASPIVFRNDESSREILRAWASLSRTDFFYKNLRCDQVALNLLALEFDIQSFCLGADTSLPKHNPLEPHPPWSKSHNFMLERISNSNCETEENFHNVRDCQELRLAYKAHPNRVLQFLPQLVLTLVYWKNSVAWLSDLFSVAVGRVGFDVFREKYFKRIK